jgi:hypothetical protein
VEVASKASVPTLAFYDGSSVSVFVSGCAPSISPFTSNFPSNMSTFKLYYTATSCGAANYISATLAGHKFDSEQVSLQTHRTTVTDQDFYAINPKGNVPTIVADGLFLNENAATLLVSVVAASCCFRTRLFVSIVSIFFFFFFPFVLAALSRYNSTPSHYLL